MWNTRFIKALGNFKEGIGTGPRDRKQDQEAVWAPGGGDLLSTATGGQAGEWIQELLCCKELLSTNPLQEEGVYCQRMEVADNRMAEGIPVSSANIFVDIDSCLTSLVKPSITIADKELRADPRCSFYHTPTTVSLSSQMSCISLHLDVRISFPWMIERTSRQSYLLSKPSW